MRVTLVRHAEVIEEYKGKYNGYIDISLSKNGRNQAKELAQKLQNVKFDKIYCSDLLRAKETLEAFEYEIEPIFSSKLREKSWGRHEGKSFTEIESEGILYENFEQWINALDGEDVESYKTRVEKYFYETIFKSEADEILIVTHAGVIKTLLSRVENISLQEAFGIKLSYSSYVTLQNFTPLCLRVTRC